MSKDTHENPLCPNLLVGVSGSIQALDIHRYLDRFHEAFAQNIKVIMTASATRIIDPKVVEMYTDDQIFLDFWDKSLTIKKIPHIQLSRWADLFVIVPATADIMGKAANGIADDLLSTTILSYTGSIVFAPSMNKSMWNSKALQRNRKLLEEDGHYVIHPEEGIALATGERDAVSSTPDILLMHLQHVRMKQLRNEYWDDAIHEKPLTPAEKIKQRRTQQSSIKMKVSGSTDQ